MLARYRLVQEFDGGIDVGIELGVFHFVLDSGCKAQIAVQMIIEVLNAVASVGVVRGPVDFFVFVFVNLGDEFPRRQVTHEVRRDRRVFECEQIGAVKRDAQRARRDFKAFFVRHKNGLGRHAQEVEIGAVGGFDDVCELFGES